MGEFLALMGFIIVGLVVWLGATGRLGEIVDKWIDRR